MKASKFIGIFANWFELPLDPQVHVKKAILEHFPGRLQIDFFPDADLNPEIMRGEFKMLKIKEHDEWHRHAQITVSTKQDLKWQRFVACKEQMHVFDAPDNRVSSSKAVNTLIEKLRQSRDKVENLESYGADGIPAAFDYLAEFYAAAVMFPMAARNLVRPKVDAGTMTLDEVVDLVGIPKSYVEDVLADSWPHLHSALIRL